jgi:hypothetical protein
MSEAKTTTDHAAIRAWAEARGGRPRRRQGTGGKGTGGGGAGVLQDRLRPEGGGTGGDLLGGVLRDLRGERARLLHQEETKDGSESRFFKLVRR